MLSQGPSQRGRGRDRTSFDDPLYYAPEHVYPQSPRSYPHHSHSPRPSYSSPSAASLSPVSRDPPSYSSNLSSPPLPPRFPSPADTRASPGASLGPSSSFLRPRPSHNPSTSATPSPVLSSRDPALSLPVLSHSQELPRSLSALSFSDDSVSDEAGVDSVAYEASVEQDESVQGGSQSRRFNSQEVPVSIIHRTHHSRSRDSNNNMNLNLHRASSNNDSSSVCHFGSILGGMFWRSLSILFSDAGAAYEHIEEVTVDDTDFVQSLTCPISKQIMQDPVVDTYGHSYERSAILQWLEKNRTSPNTRQPLRREDLRPNHALQAVIEQYIQDQQRQQLAAEGGYAH